MASRLIRNCKVSELMERELFASDCTVLVQYRVQPRPRSGYVTVALTAFWPVRVLESIGVLERAMGIEPTSEAWEARYLIQKSLELAAFCRFRGQLNWKKNGKWKAPDFFWGFLSATSDDEEGRRRVQDVCGSCCAAAPLRRTYSECMAFGRDRTGSIDRR